MAENAGVQMALVCESLHQNLTKKLQDGSADRHLTQRDRQARPTKRQTHVDRLTGGINAYLIVHCSAVVSLLHPAKWLLINQPDLLLSYSADRPLASGSRRGCY